MQISAEVAVAVSKLMKDVWLKLTTLSSTGVWDAPDCICTWGCIMYQQQHDLSDNVVDWMLLQHCCMQCYSKQVTCIIVNIVIVVINITITITIIIIIIIIIVIIIIVIVIIITVVLLMLVGFYIGSHLCQAVITICIYGL